MASEWEETTLGALVDSNEAHLQTGPFGTALKAAEYSAEGVPLISVGEIREGHFEIGEDTPRVSVETTRRLPKFVLETGDIVFGRKGGTDRNSMVQPSQRGWFLGSDGIRLRLAEKYDARFFSYQMRSPATRAWLTQNSEGTTMPSLNQAILGRIPIVVPPLPEQKAIAHILGTLDDKIELNRRMNATLEAMARALFQSWFVDFDPVRAKVDGKKPGGIDDETAALFPSHFQDSSAGPIPQGWEVKPLRELTSYLSRGIGPSYVDAGGVCVLNQKCVRDHRVDFSKARRHDLTKRPIIGRTLQLFDILVNSTGVGTLGRIAQVLTLNEDVIVDSHITIVRASADVDSCFLGIGLLLRENEVEELAEGSTGQTELSRTRLGGLKIVTPPGAIQEAFGCLVRPLLESIALNDNQSRNLSVVRDALLPKLLGGEVRAPLSLLEQEEAEH